MRTWDYGINGHPDWRIGSITLYRRPWWLSFLEWLAFWLSWDWLYKIPLPNRPVIVWDREHPKDTACSPREWFGSVGGIVHSFITDPLFQYVWAHPRNRKIEVKLGYERVRELFRADDPEVFDAEDERHPTPPPLSPERAGGKAVPE